nr:D-aminoacylase [Chthoniobacterales bacterium]
MYRSLFFFTLCGLMLGSCAHGQSAAGQKYDVLIKDGTVYDGSGGEGRKGDVALRGDRIAAVGDLKGATAGLTIDAHGLAVAPGFINM